MSKAHKTLRFSLRTLPSSIEIAIGENLLESDFLLKLCSESKKKIAIIADNAVAPIGETLKKRLKSDLFIFEGKETSKTREAKQSLEDELMKAKFGRDTLLIALGGGVTTDLVGFLASTYMRGVPLILVPTTLLAMADAAIGGKTGVDTPFGKNLIGSFYHSIATLIDTTLLKTLPKAEWLNGLAEILKYGLITDESHWKFCEDHCDHWQNPNILSDLILSSISAKMKVVEEDPEEQGKRRILNFGHTIAHALEQISHYQVPHGIAVAMGCQAESYLSYYLGYLCETDFERILKLYRNCEFPATLPKAFQAKKFLEAMHLDKKSKGGDPRFVLIDRIGNCLPFEGEYCRAIAQSDLDALISWLEMTYG